MADLETLRYLKWRTQKKLRASRKIVKMEREKIREAKSLIKNIDVDIELEMKKAEASNEGNCSA